MRYRYAGSSEATATATGTATPTSSAAGPAMPTKTIPPGVPHELLVYEQTKSSMAASIKLDQHVVDDILELFDNPNSDAVPPVLKKAWPSISRWVARLIVDLIGFFFQRLSSLCAVFFRFINNFRVVTFSFEISPQRHEESGRLQEQPGHGQFDGFGRRRRRWRRCQRGQQLRPRV